MANIPEFNSTPWSLPVGCYSIIIKHEAIIRSFPGGVRAFETAYKPIRKSWVLYLLMALSSEALDRLLARLGEDGLRCGFDFAVADKVRRPIAECPGVTFTGHGRHQWTVDVEEVDVRDADALIPPAAAAAIYSVIIKTSTIDRSFPGGRGKFFRRHDTA